MRFKVPILAALSGLCVACSGGDKDDTGSLPSGSECPDASAWIGDDTWPLKLTVAEDVTVCVLYNDTQDLKTNLARKARLTIRSGTYPLPDSGEGTVLLPACVSRADGTGPSSVDAGTVSSSSFTPVTGGTYYTSDIRQPMSGADDPRDLEVIVRFHSPDGEPPEPVYYDGTVRDPFAETGVDLVFCDGGYHEDGYCNGTRSPLYTCMPGDSRVEQHTVGFDGGELTVVLRLESSGDGTEPGAFVHAQGTLDGTAFVQDDYFKLLYHPEHHHFSRDFGVLFDAPIGSACGVAAYYVDPWEEAPATVVKLIDCAVEPIEERAVTSEAWERL
jgi:hypothetical protein